MVEYIGDLTFGGESGITYVLFNYDSRILIVSSSGLIGDSVFGATGSGITYFLSNYDSRIMIVSLV